MGYTKSQLLSLGAKLEEIFELRKRIVDIRIFDYIDDLVLDNKTLDQLDYTIDLYQEYLSFLLSFNKNSLEAVLKSLRNIEVIDNHVVENENYNLLLSYQETHHSSAINYLIKKLYVDKEEISPVILAKCHEILMRGTSNEDDILSRFRKGNMHFVGYLEQGHHVIQFLPISHDEIKLALQLFCSYYNQEENDKMISYIKPFIIHGLLASLQVFEDGNTRAARCMQHIKMFEVTRNLFQVPLNLPALYFSKTYIPYRKEYRDLISKLAINPSIQTWNEWIVFNLRKVQDQIYFNSNNLERTRKL